MNPQSIFSLAKLGADRAEVTCRGDVVGLDVAADVGQVLVGVGTIGAVPRTVRIVLDHLRIDQSVEIFTKLKWITASSLEP